MQTITTSDWTEITGLDSSKSYVLQAQTTINFNGGVSGANGYYPITVMWLQGSEPSADDVGIITDQIKANASTSIYVKTAATPINIVVQEVI